jgi:hypothetical protein
MLISVVASSMVPAPSTAIMAAARTDSDAGSPRFKPEPIPNVVIVALANNLARTAWSVMQRDTRYDSRLLAA